MTPKPDPSALRVASADAAPRRSRWDDVDSSARKRWLGPAVAVGLAMGAASIAALVLTGMQDNAIYSKPVDQLLAQKAKFVGRPVRADGILVHHSLVRRDQPCEWRFTIAKRDVELPVRFAQCVVPDTFRDVDDVDVGVTVEGQLQADGTFEATSVLAKCPSKYEMQERKQRGEEMPHGPFAEQLAPTANVPQARP
ncbi:MAG: cytochrome c maturation protein CcmE [Polyangiaceae bacterium]|jgi:cytochrome c-type biogenesis protein CcmE